MRLAQREAEKYKSVRYTWQWYNKICLGASLAIQWLRLHASPAGDSDPWRGNWDSQASWCSQKKKICLVWGMKIRHHHRNMETCEASQVAQGLRIRLPMKRMREMQVRFLGWEDALEKEMASHSNILAWDIPWTEEPSGLQPMGLQRIGCDWAIEHLST